MTGLFGVQNKNLAGIIYISIAIFMLASMDAVAKSLVTADYSVFQILFIRGCINFVILSLLMPFMGGLKLVRTSRFFVHGVRGFFGFLAPFCFFTALSSMPLAETTVIFFVSPFIMTALSVPLFKEKVGIHRWGAIIVGFCGVLYVAQPTSGEFNSTILIVLAGSFSYCFLMLASRWLGQTDHTFTIVFYVTFWTTIFSSAGAYYYWQDIPTEDLAAIGLMALLSLGGNFCIVKAFNIGEVGVITPFEYTGLIWAVLLGIIFFNEIPESNVWVGTSIIAASGLYMVYRENKKRPADNARVSD
ncbi:MAG: DMT family transporter [Sneathiella sp.]|nr:DMT family transporter [Sneathiella sp.]